MSITYVNHKGEPLSLERLAQQHKRPTKARNDPEPTHKGWKVVGFSQQALDKAKAEHLRRQEESAEAVKKAGGIDKVTKAVRDALATWDEERYMDRVNPLPVRAKPYEIQQAAQQCAEMDRKAGWRRVQVIEMVKGRT